MQNTTDDNGDNEIDDEVATTNIIWNLENSMLLCP